MESINYTARKFVSILVVFALALAMALAAATPAQAASGTMYCGQGGYPYTYAQGPNTYTHWVQGTPSTPYPGTVWLSWTYRTGNRSWSVTGSGLQAGNGVCYT